MIYEAFNEAVLARVPKTTKRVLDLGCGSGALGRTLKEQIDCEVTGVTHSESEAALAAQHLDEVLVRDLNDFALVGTRRFDCVICSHVLEHLYRPDEVLRQLRRKLSANGTLIVALPNVLHWRQRLQFLRGSFRYTDGGLMDRTHYRFFDWITARELMVSSGYSIVEAAAEGGFPLSRFLSTAGRGLDRAALKTSPGLFGVQFVFVCQSNGE